MTPDKPDTAAAPTDPTVLNELRELDALTAASPTPDAAQQSAALEATSERRALRVKHYTEKVTPFVQSFGARLKMPLSEIEVGLLSDALADVGAEIIPEGEEEVSPWKKLLAVSLGIAIPRVLANLLQRGKKDGGQGAPPSAASPPAKPEGPNSVVDLARDWDGHDKPH